MPAGASWQVLTQGVFDVGFKLMLWPAQLECAAAVWCCTKDVALMVNTADAFCALVTMYRKLSMKRVYSESGLTSEGAGAVVLLRGIAVMGLSSMFAHVHLALVTSYSSVQGRAESRSSMM